MMFQRRSDVVESRVEQAIRDTENRRNAASISVRNSPDAPAFTGAARILTTTRHGKPALSIDQLADLSIDHIIGDGVTAPDLFSCFPGFLISRCFARNGNA
jgi:hypothetical protein